MWQIGKERNDFFFEEQIWWWITCLDCLFFKVLSAEPNEIHMLATSWTVILLSSSKTTVTWSTLWPILCVSGYPAHRNLQQTSRHFLTSKTIIWLFHCLLYRGYFQHFKSPGTVFPQFRQNLMHTHCSFKPATFHVYQNCKWNDTYTYIASHHSTTTHVTSLLKAGNYSEESIPSAPHERSWCWQQYCHTAVTPHTTRSHVHKRPSSMVQFSLISRLLNLKHVQYFWSNDLTHP